VPHSTIEPPQATSQHPRANQTLEPTPFPFHCLSMDRFVHSMRPSMCFDISAAVAQLKPLGVAMRILQWIRSLFLRFMSRVEQPQGLISVLLDRGAEFGDRDDAAMDLGAFDDQSAFDALLAVATDPTEDSDLHDTCG